MRGGAGRLGISRTEWLIEAGGIVDSIVELDMEGECTRLAEIWLDEESSGTTFSAGLRILAGSVFRGNFVLNLSTILADAVTSLRHR